MKRVRSYLESTPESEQSSAVVAHLASLDTLEKHVPDLASHLIGELENQRSHLKMIASENYCSLPVQLAMGNHLTDKYAEGIPGHRYYAGCEHVDSIENMAIAEAKKLFGAAHAFVQPHSGADANLIAYYAILSHRVETPFLQQLGKKRIQQLTPQEIQTLRELFIDQKLLSMDMSAGGHITHGYSMNLSSKLFRTCHYGVSHTTEQIDYDALRAQAIQEKPTIILAGFSSYSRKLNFKIFREIADEVNATLMVDMAHISGMVAGKAYQGEENPIPYADIVTSTTHKTLRGPRGGLVLCTQELAPYVDRACPFVMGGPLPHVIAAKLVAFREAQTTSFQDYIQRVLDSARQLATSLQEKGIRVISGGTDNHIIVCDTTTFSLSGKQAESALVHAHITCNRNAIPFDPLSPLITSGIRLGTQALVTRGMGPQDMKQIAEFIHQILSHTKPVTQDGKPSRTLYQTPPDVLTHVQEGVKKLLAQHPLYPELELSQEVLL